MKADDIVATLRGYADRFDDDDIPHELGMWIREAADEIERLQSVIESFISHGVVKMTDEVATTEVHNGLFIYIPSKRCEPPIIAERGAIWRCSCGRTFIRRFAGRSEWGNYWAELSKWEQRSKWFRHRFRNPMHYQSEETND